MPDCLALGIGALVGLALLAAFMDRRRNSREELDRVGWVNWPLTLVLSLVGALMLTMLWVAG